jgi:hypothetical protein
MSENNLKIADKIKLCAVSKDPSFYEALYYLVSGSQREIKEVHVQKQTKYVIMFCDSLTSENKIIPFYYNYTLFNLPPTSLFAYKSHDYVKKHIDRLQRK